MIGKSSCAAEAKELVEAAYPKFQSEKNSKKLEWTLRRVFPSDFDRAPEVKVVLHPRFQTMPPEFQRAIQNRRTIFVHGPSGYGKTQMLSHLFGNREKKYLYVDRLETLKNFNPSFHEGIFLDGLDLNKRDWPYYKLKWLLDSSIPCQLWISRKLVCIPGNVSACSIVLRYYCLQKFIHFGCGLKNLFFHFRLIASLQAMRLRMSFSRNTLKLFVGKVIVLRSK